MNCALCGREITKDMTKFEVFREDTPHRVCGQCFMLVSILDEVRQSNNPVNAIGIPYGKPQ